MTAEHLTDGWEPDLPVSDTLLRRFLFNLAAFPEVPATAAGARTLRRDDFTAADLGRPAAMHNAATL
ncbi:MAG TPA: N-acetyltransferase, partial [Actinomycetota bacterium]|nr:N-acetyltransferase [Actinomycetota bacterium]